MYEYELDQKTAIKRGEELYPDGFVLEEDRAPPFLHAGPMGLESWAQAATRWRIVPKKGEHPDKPER
ncbi:hypothetical protein [Paracidovorax wautersii]|nr:hypothetical protein [Paracidovorax wautersii]